MSFREKTHWVAFIAIALAFGWYFLSYPWALSHSNAGMGAAGGMLVVVTLAIILMMSIVVGVIAARAPADASLKADEREQHIHQFGTHLAYYPLVLGVYANIVAAFNQVSPAIMLNLLLATVVLAELVRVGAQLWGDHRGI